MPPFSALLSMHSPNFQLTLKYERLWGTAIPSGPRTPLNIINVYRLQVFPDDKKLPWLRGHTREQHAQVSPLLPFYLLRVKWTESSMKCRLLRQVSNYIKVCIRGRRHGSLNDVKPWILPFCFCFVLRLFFRIFSSPFNLLLSSRWHFIRACNLYN